MKRSVALAIIVAASLTGSAISGEPPPKEFILAQMDKASKALTTLEAELLQVKSYPQLSLSDPPESGHIYLERKGSRGTRLRLEIVEPEPRSVAVEDGRYVFYQPRIRQALVGTLGPEGSRGKTGFLSYLLGDLTAAEEDFDIRSVGGEIIDGKPTVQLRLSAKPGNQSPYVQIDLWVQTELWLPVRQELTESNHSLTRIELKNVSINEELDDRVFEVEIPGDVERVQG